METKAEIKEMQKIMEIMMHKITVLEKAMLHIVNSLDDKKQKSLRDKIKSNTKSKKHEQYS